MDLEYAKMIHKRYQDIPFYLSVGNEDITNTNNQELIQKLLLKYEWLVNTVVEDNQLNNVRVLPQLHALLWGNKRGV